MTKKIIFLTLFNLVLQLNSQTITDIEGNSYNTVTIGDQVWMKENLRTTKYNDGTSIPKTIDKNAWTKLTTPAYIWYDNDSASYAQVYGALYNWNSVNQGALCPSGWHVSTNEDWVALINYLGGEDAAALKLREVGTTHWIYSSGGITNETEFTALPGGYMGNDFTGIGEFSYWWSSTEYDTNKAWYSTLYCISAIVKIRNNYYDKDRGCSVRCIKDSAISTELITVYFNTMGGSTISDIIIDTNSLIIKPDDPIKSDYFFDGWYKEIDYINAWDFSSDIVTSDITLYAKWTATTLIIKQQFSDIEIYPNPANDKLFIKSDKSSNVVTKIFNLQGKQVLNKEISEKEIDISGLSKGIYIIKIIDSEDIKIIKLIKE